MQQEKHNFKRSRYLHITALVCLIGLIVLCLAWELWLAPLRSGGTLLALKAVPLVFALKGVSQARIYTLQWLSMLSLLYLMEGIVRAWSDMNTISVYLAVIEIALSGILYLSAIFYVRPAKLAARKNRKK